jgi:hypothetical protein
MSQPKTPTAQGVSRLLANAGFQRSQPRPGALSAPTEGFTVSAQLFGRVRVEHKTGYDRGPNAVKRRDEALTRYTQTLAIAGYQVERDELWHGLNVTAKESGEGES